MRRSESQSWIPTRNTVVVSLLLALGTTACQSPGGGTGAAPVGGTSAVSAYGASCLTGAAAGAVLAAILDRNKNKPLLERQSDLRKAAAAGCALGIAATAVGRIMDSAQQAQHEAEMQKEAKRRALEQQQFAANTQRIQSQPIATPQQRAARDQELERARAAYQESLNKPVLVALPNGGSSTIQVQRPSTGDSSPGAPGTAGTGGTAPAAAGPGCTEYSVLVRTPAGQARQFETWCPGSGGQMVRAEVRETPTA